MLAEITYLIDKHGQVQVVRGLGCLDHLEEEALVDDGLVRDRVVKLCIPQNVSKIML